MKKIFIQFWQWILKHRKKLIYGAFVFLIGQVCFFGLEEFWIENQVFADNQETSVEARAQEKVNTLSFIQKIIYVLIYPMLVIAGTLVDNSMVYWEFFHFDVVLWELRNVMRNLANFTLWFIFIYKIFKYLIWGQKSWEIKKLLISLLIAWIWIQASWFVMAALIDMSTILTYWIWWLPITILGSDNDDWWREQAVAGEGDDYCLEEEPESEEKQNYQEKYNPYIYKTLINVDVEEEDSSAIRMYLTNTIWEHIYISECASFKYTWAQEILIAPSVIYYSYYENGTQIFKPTEIYLCHYGWQVYQFKDSLVKDRNDCTTYCDNSDVGVKTCCKDMQNMYVSDLKNMIKDLKSKEKENLRGFIEDWILLEEWNAHVPGGIYWALRTGQYPTCDMWLDVNNEGVWGGKNKRFQWAVKTQRLQDTLDDKSYVWVFTELYASLMTSGKNIIIGSTGNSWFLNLLAIMLELWHLIAIAIPLIVVGIIFMIRIGILWIAIIISPFIAIMTAFEDDIWNFLLKKIEHLKYFKLTTLIWIIFSPAVVCLAISLSTVFVRIISNIDFSWSWAVENEILRWLIQINIENVSAGIWRFLKAIIWAGITWYIVWAAVQSSELWKKGFVQDMKKIAAKSIWSIPIIPIPTKDGWVDFIWANSAFGLNGTEGIISQVSNKIKKKIDTQENKAVDALFGEWTSEEDAASKRAAEYEKRVLGMHRSPGSDWTKQEFEIWEKWSEKVSMSFDKLNDKAKESVINGINGLEESHRKEFSKSEAQEVTINNVTYRFRETGVKDGETVNIYKYMTDDEYDKEYSGKPQSWSTQGGQAQQAQQDNQPKTGTA